MSIAPVSQSSSSRHSRTPVQANIDTWPRLERPLALICGVCNAKGRYRVGRVTINPHLMKSASADKLEDAVGFTDYFRCKKCDAGGPWKMPTDTLMRVTALAMMAVVDEKKAPVLFGWAATFDKHLTRYATDAEIHLKRLIEHEPERSFLWVRLANLYSHSGRPDLAEATYRRALEINAKDIEAHGMFAQVLAEAERPLEAIPHWQSVLKHAREARSVDREVRRNLVRAAIEGLLEAHARSKGAFDLLPKATPTELAARAKDEPLVLHLVEFDLNDSFDIERLCDTFVDSPGRHWSDWFENRRRRAVPPFREFAAVPLRKGDEPVARNAPCTCGSGRKFKKCCGC